MVSVRLLEDSEPYQELVERIDGLEKYEIHTSLASLKDADAGSGRQYTLVTSEGKIEYSYLPGNYTGKGDDDNIVYLNTTPPATGALVKQSSHAISFQALGGESVIRSLDSKLNEIVSATDRGADPLGIEDSSSAINAALTDLCEVRIPKGTYLCMSPIVIPTQASLYFDPGAVLMAGIDNITVLKTNGFTYNSSLRNVRINGNGKANITAMSLDNFRHRAIVECPDIYGCEVGIDLKQLCWDTVLMAPWIRSTRFPIRVADGSNAVDIFHPALDGFERGIIIKKGPTHDTVNVRVFGGYIQNGYVGIEDNQSVGLIVDGTYFEGNGCKLVGSISGNILTVTELKSSGIHLGQSIFGPDVAIGTSVLEQLSGEKWKEGTYRLTVAQTVSSRDLLGEGYDISLIDSLRPNISRTQHYSDFGGTAAIRARKTLSLTVFDPLMTNGSRSIGLFDVDDGNINFTSFVAAADLGGPNVPIGITPKTAGKIVRQTKGTFLPTISGGGTAGDATYVEQHGKFVFDGDRVTINLQLRWSAHTGTGSIVISGIPIELRPNNFLPARVGDVVCMGFDIGGTDNYVAFNEVGTNLNIKTVIAGTPTQVDLPNSGTILISLNYII